jgi:hypothetical protein
MKPTVSPQLTAQNARLRFITTSQFAPSANYKKAERPSLMRNGAPPFYCFMLALLLALS